MKTLVKRARTNGEAAMKIFFQVNYEYEIDVDNLLGDSPEDFLKHSMEEDPVGLLDNAVVLKYKLIKVVESDKAEDEDLDDDGLHEIDEEEIEV
jgi:hypothetical protein